MYVYIYIFTKREREREITEINSIVCKTTDLVFVLPCTLSICNNIYIDVIIITTQRSSFDLRYCAIIPGTVF